MVRKVSPDTGVVPASGDRSRPPRSETRQRVLDAAYRVFSRGGIAGSSLDEVAADAGLTKGAVYSNFTSKDDLVLTLMEERAMRRVATALAAFAEEPDTEHGVWQVAKVLMDAMHTDVSAHRLLAENYAMSHRNAEHREALRRRRSNAREAISAALVQVQASSGLRLRLTPDETAVVFLALSNGLGIEADIDPEAVPADLLGRILPLFVAHTEDSD